MAAVSYCSFAAMRIKQKAHRTRNFAIEQCGEFDIEGVVKRILFER